MLCNYIPNSAIGLYNNLILLSMKTNMSAMDKIIRVIVAVAALLLVYFEVVQGVYSYILLAIVAIFLLTSLVGFCPIYSIFGLNTCTVKKKD